MGQPKGRTPHNKMAQSEFIFKANTKHAHKYSYEFVNYINSSVKVTITCKRHGNFSQTPRSHLSGQKCPKCALEQRAKKRALGRLKFIQKAVHIHKAVYEYSNVVYVNSRTKIDIHCTLCAKTFKQNPDDHLQGHGCPVCSKSYINLSKPINFYVLQLRYLGEVAYKIGISNKSVKQRYKSDNPHKTISETLLETYFIDSYDAVLFEKQVKEHFAAFRYTGNLKFFGKTKNTEVFSVNPLNYITENLKISIFPV